MGRNLSRSSIVLLGSLVIYLCLTSCTGEKQKGTHPGLATRDEVIQIHHDLNQQQAALNQAGLSFSLKKSPKYEILDFTVAFVPGSFPPAQRKLALQGLQQHLSGLIQKYSGKYVYFGENPTEVLNAKSKGSLEKALAQTQSLLSQM